MESKKTLFVLLACALFASVLCEGSPPTSPTSATPATSTFAPSTSTDAPASSTLAPTTNPTPPTIPTTVPTTPSTPTPTTPTTPAPAPPTTTAAPTPAPTPAPAEGRGNWTISDAANNVTCIIAQMILSAKVAYPLQTANKTDTKTLSVPPSANASGSCDPSAQWIKLSWNDEKNSIQVDFKKNDTTSMYFISKIDLTFVADSKTFPNISTEYADKSVQLLRMKEDFMIKVNQSFRCSREQDLPLAKNDSAIKVELALSSVQLQAFHKDNTAMFGAAQDCELDTPDIVPIAVGCALAALVCVVLVAYLIGRRRSQARGYLSIFLD